MEHILRQLGFRDSTGSTLLNPVEVLDKNKSWECALGGGGWTPTADEVERAMKLLGELGLSVQSVPVSETEGGQEFFNKRGQKIAVFFEAKAKAKSKSKSVDPIEVPVVPVEPSPEAVPEAVSTIEAAPAEAVSATETVSVGLAPAPSRRRKR